MNLRAWLVVSSMKLISLFLGISPKVSCAMCAKNVALFCAPWGMTANLHLPFGVENVVQSRDSGSMYTTKNASLMSVSDQYLDPRVWCMTCSRSGIGKWYGGVRSLIGFRLLVNLYHCATSFQFSRLNISVTAFGSHFAMDAVILSA